MTASKARPSFCSLVYRTLWLCVYLSCRRRPTTALAENRTIYIGGLFSLNGTSYSKDGHSELLAAKLAIDDINDGNVLPGYQLTMYFNDTQCDPGVGADALFDQLYRKPPMIMLLGSACSEVSKHIAQIVPFWNLVMLSYASTSVALTDRELYPTFYRTVAPDSAHNAARAAFLHHFRWKKVAILRQDEELFSLMTDRMQSYLEEYSNISVIAVEGFIDDPSSQLQQLKELDARIIIGTFHEKQARRVFCQAYKHGLYGSKYVWILVGWYRQDWLLAENDTDCSVDELSEATEGYIAVESLNKDLNGEPGISGMTPGKFEELLESNGEGMTTYAPQTYDAVWTIALVIQRLLDQANRTENGRNISLTDLQYRNELLQDRIKTILSEIQFKGISGTVSFDGPDRKSITVFEQNQGGVLHRIAIYDPESNNLTFNATDCVPVEWQGGKVPSDQLMIIDEIVHINRIAFLSITLLSVSGIFLALLFLLFNCRYRNTKYIKLSSPNLNNLVIIGSILVYICLILLGMNSTIVSDNYVLSIICTMLKESRLFLMVLSLFIVDASVIMIWICIDPLHLQEKILPKRSIEANDTVFIPIIEQCTCERMEVWLGILYAYKGLLLLFGAFLAWETRKVKIEALNDSQYIGMSVYNVLVMSIITVIISNVIGTGQQVTTTFLIVSSFILISTTNTLCLLFLPKIYAIRKGSAVTGNPVTSGPGLEVKGRTCRFQVSQRQDFREKLFRAEVHNRAFKKELAQLDVRIKMLQDEMEELLESELDEAPTTSNDESTAEEQERLFHQSSSSELLINLPETTINNYYEIERQRQHENGICCDESTPMFLNFEVSDDAAIAEPEIYKISPSAFIPMRVRKVTLDNTHRRSPNRTQSMGSDCNIHRTSAGKKSTQVITREDHEREMERLRNEIIVLQGQLAELDSYRMIYYV
ncbi:gamma-aminobutyric acid type B receptor subunit 1-like isoform X2 [Ptychodera flava]|uniref:gamma-aminobutyric acid type B receptor subunit 1-like isoform X2 n=1 Tax=Ptychodera flava TaxID=63121 RepID=UPI003969E3D7